jgi:predicted metal-dependent RNase
VPRTGGFDVSPEFHFDAYDAGHILGSTSLALTITENGKKTHSGFFRRYREVRPADFE